MTAADSSTIVPPVGIAGAGRMGGAYALLIVQSGRTVLVSDPSPDRQAAMRDLGCTVVASAADLLAAGADPLVLSLATEEAFDGVIGDLCTASVPGHRPTVIDTSTLHPATKELGRARLAEVGIVLLDCPVSGTGAQARTGDLVVYASGPTAAVASARPVLELFSRKVYDIGAFGTGSTIKLLANLLVGIHNAAAAEMLAFAERAGVDPTLALTVIADGAGQSRMLEQRGPGMARHDYGYGASVDLFRKDLALINRLAREVGAMSPLLEVVTGLYDRAAQFGLGAEESAAVHRLYLDSTPLIE